MLQTNSLHVEYDFGPLKKGDFVDISTENNLCITCNRAILPQTEIVVFQVKNASYEAFPKGAAA